MFSISTLRHHFTYIPQSGRILWKSPTSSRTRKGSVAGSKDNNGYWRVSFKGKTLSGHRLAWALHYGCWPKRQIDHIDRNPLNNAISNLRDVSASENCLNRRHRKAGEMRHGGKGVTRTSKGMWQVQVHDPSLGRARYFGVFKSKDDALSAAKSARSEMDL